MEHQSLRLAQNLSRIRKTRGLSLDKMAALTGVSKAMLAQIEKGNSNPTISIIWKIANGLHVSFSTLLEDDTKAVSVVNRDEVTMISGEDGAFRSYPLFPFDVRTRIEVYYVEMDAGCTHQSEPHNEGVEEYILVERGALEIEINGTVYAISAGESVRFRASTQHTYMNKCHEMTCYHAIISY